MKVLIILILITIIGLVFRLGFRYTKYHSFIGTFYSDSGDYYQFNLYSWKYGSDGTNKQECDLWNCNIESGHFYYIKEKKLYLRYDKKSVFITSYKIEKKNNKTYLYFYDSDKLEYTYIKGY